MAPIPKAPRERSRTYLRQWRDFRDLSQEEVAFKLDIDRSTISRIERGESPYDQDILERLALIYGCDPEDLISCDPLRPDPIKFVVSNLKHAPRDVRDRALKVLDALLKAG